MDNAGGPSRADQLDLMLTYKEQAHARTKAALTAALQRAEQAEAEAERAWHAHREMWQDRYDALDARTTEGMSAAEWQLRTGKAERRAREAEAALAQTRAKRDSLIKRLDFWIECNNGERANGRMPTFLNPYTILLWIGDKRVAAEADAAQPPALPPLPEGWCKSLVSAAFVPVRKQEGYDEIAVSYDELGVGLFTRPACYVNVADLITVLRHAEAAHLKLKGGAK